MRDRVETTGFAEKVAIVTGAASGIGKATAAMFARGGADVVVDRNHEGGERSAALIRDSGGSAIFLYADVSKSTDIASVIASTEKRLGGIDILVNNAAVQVMKPLTETSEEEWENLLGVNLKGVFLGCKYAIPVMLRKGKGSIINVASVLGMVGDPELAAYCATKGGVIALTRAAAIGYAPRGIRINCICPGDVDTEMVREFFAARPDPTAAREEIRNHYALRRIASPDEIANCIGFLASEDGGIDWLTSLFTQASMSALPCSLHPRTIGSIASEKPTFRY